MDEVAQEMYSYFRNNYKEAGEIYPYDGAEGGFQGDNYVNCLEVLTERFPTTDSRILEKVADRLNDEGNWVDPLKP